MYLSTHFFKYFSLFSIFLLCFHIFTIFDIFSIYCLYILCFLKGKGEGPPLPGVRVTGHAPSVKSPEGLSTDDGCRRIKIKRQSLTGEQAPH